jgi:hypothetical protein
MEGTEARLIYAFHILPVNSGLRSDWPDKPAFSPG